MVLLRRRFLVWTFFDHFSTHPFVSLGHVSMILLNVTDFFRTFASTTLSERC